MSFKIKVESAKAASNLINTLGVDVPKIIAMRELVVNGIEACLRNKDENGRVLITKDHIHTNKLSVINVGGDFLSREIFESNLATMGNTGNILDGSVVLDANKGIGAKISYLPKAREGLKYRSVEKGEEIGLTAQMCQNSDSGCYEVPDVICEYTGDRTAWPAWGRFSEHLGGSVYDEEDEIWVRNDLSKTGTEVICMGDHSDVDTWLEFDKLGSRRKSENDGGTGYGIFRYLNHRFWDEPQVPVTVQLFRKADGSEAKLQRVRGLKKFLQSDGCSHYGCVDLTYDNTIPVKAHWAVLRGNADKKKKTNYAMSGYTSIAWKGESYNDINQHNLTVKKELGDCGVIIGWNKVLIIFEIDSSINLFTDSSRTSLIYEDRKIDKALLHEAFRQNMPQELKDWQESNQVNNVSDEDLFKDLKREIKNMGFCFDNNKSTDGKVVAISNAKRNKKSNRSSKPPSSRREKLMRKVNARQGLKSGRPPEIKFIDDPEDEYINFNDTNYTVILNQGSDLYVKRKQRILDLLKEPCLVMASLDYELKKSVLKNCLYTVFETELYGGDISWEEKREKWKPSRLESNWNNHTENEILSQVRKENRREKKRIA